LHFRARAAITNTLPTRPYRSSGRPEVMFVMERLIDLAARQYGFDRLELRRRNLVPESAMPYRNPFGMVYDSGAYHNVMERVVALGDWAGFPARRAEARGRGRYRGIGVSNYVDTATGTPRERAEITILPDGVVEVVVGTVSNGQGHETSFAQLIGEWLGVPIDTVRLVTGDTDRVSVGGGSHSGRALRLASIVMLNASRDIIAKGLQIASHVLEAAPGDIEFAEGRFRVKGTDRSLGIFDAAVEALRRNDLPDELRGPLAGSLLDYALPRADRLPFFNTELSEVPTPTHPLGIRPAGEGGTTPALGVVINAIVDALAEFGVTHIEMPATPERVWRAIHQSD
jgi:aerobic carbon-monoxide dehydrogenase large subunit